MKELAKVFSRGNGHRLEQCWREGEVAVYERWVGKGKLPAMLELIFVQVERGKEIGGKWVEEHERYPKASEWGRSGWCFGHLGYPGMKERVIEMAKNARAISGQERASWVRGELTRWKLEKWLAAKGSKSKERKGGTNDDKERQKRSNTEEREPSKGAVA